MPETVDVDPALLVWARESAGFTAEKAAEKLHVAVDRLRAWEHKSAAPSITYLRKAATLYRRPLAVFFLPAPPEEPEEVSHFRRLPGITDPTSPELLWQVRTSLARRQLLVDLGGDSDAANRLADLPRNGGGPRSLSLALRSVIGVELAEQTSWRDPKRAFWQWRAAVERLGVLVFQAWRVSAKEMSGLAIPLLPHPVVLLNSKDAYHRKIFTLFHELAHVVRSTRAVCSLDWDEADDAEERRCDEIAGEFLVPSESLQEMLTAVRGDDVRDSLPALSRHYSVSEEVVLRRLVSIGRATMEQFVQFVRERRKAAAGKKSFGRSTPQADALSRVGFAFTRAVLEAYHRKALTLADVATHLDVKVRYVPLIERAVASEPPGGGR